VGQGCESSLRPKWSGHKGPGPCGSAKEPIDDHQEADCGRVSNTVANGVPIEEDTLRPPPRVGVPCGSPIGTPALATSKMSCGGRDMTRNAHDACTERERHHEGPGFVEVIVQLFLGAGAERNAYRRNRWLEPRRTSVSVPHRALRGANV
jgi:hypothetical protein